MCDLNIVMSSFCSCLHPKQDPCLQCNKPLWNAERQSKQCGGCDRNQNELCTNCPNKIPNLGQFKINFSHRQAESIDGEVGFRLQEDHVPTPVPIPEPFEKFACRLLRLERNKATALDVIKMIPETEKYLRDFWERMYGTASELDCIQFISHHPFMQYLALILKIRVVNKEESLYHIEHVIQGIAQL